MSRAYCPKCLYPKATCLCASITEISTVTKIDILQHPSETRAAKNTARLIKLCVPETKIWIGESSRDFEELQQDLETENLHTYVLYPNLKAINAVDAFNDQKYTQKKVRILALDGTWKKAYKIWQLNTWLHRLTSIQFDDIEGQYQIRKAPKAHQLSTLECVAHTLNLCEPDLDTSPLLHAFEALKQTFDKSRS